VSSLALLTRGKIVPVHHLTSLVVTVAVETVPGMLA